ncbi:MAG TPA: hypothetical protein DEB39_00800 [Planctomycetaceae bacterium]|nr:hypothetical protein [Planctomycetaceae bacterium]
MRDIFARAMKETTKTSIFLAIAVLLTVLAIVLRPRAVELKSEEMVGKPLFPKFVDPLAVKGLEIVRAATLEGVQRFRITEQNGVWTIPSHEGYPADAKDRMPKIADALVNLTVLGIAESPSQAKDTTADHILYGVIDPTSDQLALGEGIGIRVNITAANDEPLVDMIIGKPVAASQNKAVADDAAFDRAEKSPQRYVRLVGEQAVYIVAIEADRFSTKFEDWIEKNLLDINTLDIRDIFVDEYTLEVEERMYQGRPTIRLIPDFLGDITLSYDGNATGKDKWRLERLMGFRGKDYQYIQQQMKPDEELNDETLDAAVLALNDLRIVDVAKKPEKIATALRGGDPLETLETDLTMVECGFNVVRMKDPKDNLREKTSILSKDGDFRITMKDGIRYILRFGDRASLSTGEDGDETTDGADVGFNRFLFISTEFDTGLIPKPEPEPLDTVPVAGTEKPVVKQTDSQTDADNADVDNAGVENKEVSGDDSPSSVVEKYTDEDVEAAQKRNAEIEKRNRRALDAYNTAIENGHKRSATLNARFAPWYYVIPENVYKKIRLTRLNVFRSKTTGDDGAGNTGIGNDSAGYDRAEDAHEPANDSDRRLPDLPLMNEDGFIPRLSSFSQGPLKSDEPGSTNEEENTSEPEVKDSAPETPAEESEVEESEVEEVNAEEATKEEKAESGGEGAKTESMPEE